MQSPLAVCTGPFTGERKGTDDEQPAWSCTRHSLHKSKAIALLQGVETAQPSVPVQARSLVILSAGDGPGKQPYVHLAL